MNIKNIKYKNINAFHPLAQMYFNQEATVAYLYNRLPKLENFEVQIKEKQQNYHPETRNILCNVLKNQNQNINLSENSQNNINLLTKENTFTITTGHQLNLFTGPVYCIYKIISVINLSQKLNLEFPKHHFVPIFWMASEDHDFEEISFFNYQNQKISFETNEKGAVGKISTTNIQSIFDTIKNLFGTAKNANYLIQLFENAYQFSTLAEATRYLINGIFGNKGIVILDGDDKDLKKLFLPIATQELENKTVYNEVTNQFLGSKIKLQVNPRPINLFYLEENSRERIVFEDNFYTINNTNLKYSKEDFLEIVTKNPEKISPNALLRPVYQELVLPNLAYIGGAAEIAYWLQLKSSFQKFQLTFPMLLMRNSALIVTEKQTKKLEKLALNPEDLLRSKEELTKKLSAKFVANKIDFEVQKLFLKDQFKNLYQIAKTTDLSFEKAVAAQERKQIKGLENLEKKLKKAEKSIHENLFLQIDLLQKELFQDNTWQERHQNFSAFYLEYGNAFLETLYKNFDVLEEEFCVLNI